MWECGAHFNPLALHAQFDLTDGPFRDTVSSVGVVRDKTLPGTTDGMKHVKYFRHALALDERRVKFLPEYAYEGSSLPEDCETKKKELEDRDHANILAHTKEVWFAGTHSDMWVISFNISMYLWLTKSISGGGNIVNVDMDLSAPSLRWMSYQATAAGLHMHPVKGEWAFEAPIAIHESLAWYSAWWLFEIIPWARLTYRDAKDRTFM